MTCFISASVHSQSVGRLIMLIIDLVAVIKRCLVILTLTTKPRDFFLSYSTDYFEEFCSLLYLCLRVFPRMCLFLKFCVYFCAFLFLTCKLNFF